jgi:hypothetical protein
VSNSGADGFVLPHPTGAVPASYPLSSSIVIAADQVGDFTTVDDLMSMIDRQMEILNESYANTPFRFKHMNRDDPSVATNTDWTYYADDYRQEMSRALGRGDLKTLNVYLAFGVSGRLSQFLLDDNVVVVAYAKFPSNQLDGEGDGILQRYDSLPGGGFDGVSSGYTLVHEVGHWLGLYHPFQNALITFEDFSDNNPLQPYEEPDPCQATNENDFVADTPTMDGATGGNFGGDCDTLLSLIDTEQAPDTCPNLPGKDPVFNYMNYLQPESCFELAGEFTCGQIERMYHQWLLYRDEVETCSTGEEDGIMEIEFFVQFDQMYHQLENSFYLMDADGKALFNSTRDHDDTTVYAVPDFLEDELPGIRQESLFVDLCVAEGRYTFVFEDSYGDGFGSSPAYFEIFVNGELLQRVEGNFGSQSVVYIDPPLKQDGHDSMDTPTTTPTGFPTLFPSENIVGPSVSPSDKGEGTAATVPPSSEEFSESPTPKNPTAFPPAMSPTSFAVPWTSGRLSCLLAFLATIALAVR